MIHKVLLAAVFVLGATPLAWSAEWKILFDGSSLDQWRGFGKETFPSQGWVIEEGALKHVARGGGGDIITKEKFEEFELSLEWKVAPAANSGVKYFILEERGQPIGHEYQIIDDNAHPDAAVGPIRQTAAFYDVLPPAGKELKPVGEYNHTLIRVQGETVEHWLNGVKVLEYELDSAELRTAIARSKFKGTDGFGQRHAGHILLQDHQDEVTYRDIRIRDLSSD